MTLETRTLETYEGQPFELRVEREAGKPPRLTGYAAPFNSLSKDLGGFRERIMPTAFQRVLDAEQDIRALVDHDRGKLLGRTSAKTLRVGTNDKGLWFSVDLPDTQYARDVEVLVARRDIKGMSFGFNVPAGGDRFIRDAAGQAIRELLDVDLREISATSIPAYGDTSLALRVDPALTGRIPPAPTPKRDMAARKMRAM